MFGTVSSAAIAGMLVSFVIAVLFPIALLVFWMIKQKPKFISCVIGAATFVIFALVLEQLLHTGVMTALGKGNLLAGQEKLSSNIWVYGLYGGACAAIFEEVGRFLAMKLCMKKFLDKKNAIMYGIGHGGIEAILIVGIAEISNLASSLAINSGSIETVLAALPEDQKELMIDQLSSLWTTPASAFYFAGVERISAVFLHICLSYLVYRFVKYQEKSFFIMAIAIHFVIDFITVILNSFLPMVALEAILAVAVVGLIIFVVNKYKAE